MVPSCWVCHLALWRSPLQRARCRTSKTLRKENGRNIASRSAEENCDRRCIAASLRGPVLLFFGGAGKCISGGGPVNARLFENQQEAMVFVYISVVPYLHAPFKKVERPSTPLHTCEGLILPLQGARTSIAGGSYFHSSFGGLPLAAVYWRRLVNQLWGARKSMSGGS